MTVAVEQEKEMAEFGSDVNEVNPSDYSCQILLEKTTLEAANDTSFPNPTEILWQTCERGLPLSVRKQEFQKISLVIILSLIHADTLTSRFASSMERTYLFIV